MHHVDWYVRPCSIVVCVYDKLYHDLMHNSTLRTNNTTRYNLFSISLIQVSDSTWKYLYYFNYKTLGEQISSKFTLKSRDTMD